MITKVEGQSLKAELLQGLIATATAAQLKRIDRELIPNALARGDISEAERLKLDAAVEAQFSLLNAAATSFSASPSFQRHSRPEP